MCRKALGSWRDSNTLEDLCIVRQASHIGSENLPPERSRRPAILLARQFSPLGVCSRGEYASPRCYAASYLVSTLMYAGAKLCCVSVALSICCLTPQMHGCITSPGTPSLSAGLKGAHRECGTAPRRRLPQYQVGRREGIGFKERP
jgi:hypothetical protein